MDSKKPSLAIIIADRLAKKGSHSEPDPKLEASDDEMGESELMQGFLDALKEDDAEAALAAFKDLIRSCGPDDEE